MMAGTRSLKKTAEITPRLAVLPRAWPYERASVVNSKRRASVWLVCHPLMVTVSYGPSTHLRASAAVVSRASMVLSPSTDSATATRTA